MEIRVTDLVLGGEGLIGTELVRALCARNHRVVSLDLRTGCDLRYVDNLPYADCDRIWFLAWDTGGAKYIEAADRQHQMFKHNCELSARVFDAISHTKRPFLFVTSQLAGQPNGYGLTKLMAEHWAAQLGGKVARLWNTYGWEEPNTRSHVITDLVLSGLNNGRIECMSDGQERRRFIYKSDSVAALIQLFDRALMSADICGGEWLTIEQVAEEVARQLGVKVKLGQAKGSELIVDPINPLPDWQPTVSLSEGISKVIEEAREFLAQRRATTRLSYAD